jgi:lipoprotein signal peptidase
MTKQANRGVIIFLLAAIADRATKHLALSGAFGEIYLNRGISFSLMDRSAPAGLIIALAGICLLGLASIKSRNFRAAPGFPLLWAGAVSNLADRFIYGHVVDWIRIVIFMNLADLCLILGGFMIIKHWFEAARLK